MAFIFTIETQKLRVSKKKQKKIDLTKNTFKVLSWQDNQSFRMKKKNVLHEKGKV